MSKRKPSFYAVARGRNVGVYASWTECEIQVSGFAGAMFKGFSSRPEAEAFIAANSRAGGDRPDAAEWGRRPVGDRPGRANQDEERPRGPAVSRTTGMYDDSGATLEQMDVSALFQHLAQCPSMAPPHWLLQFSEPDGPAAALLNTVAIDIVEPSPAAAASPIPPILSAPAAAVSPEICLESAASLCDISAAATAGPLCTPPPVTQCQMLWSEMHDTTPQHSNADPPLPVSSPNVVVGSTTPLGSRVSSFNGASPAAGRRTIFGGTPGSVVAATNRTVFIPSLIPPAPSTAASVPGATSEPPSRTYSDAAAVVPPLEGVAARVRAVYASTAVKPEPAGASMLDRIAAAAAAAAALQHPASQQLDTTRVTAYVDGACSGNGQARAFAGFGCYVEQPSLPEPLTSSIGGAKTLPASMVAIPLHPREAQTNNRAEMTAMIHVLATLEREDQRRARAQQTALLHGSRVAAFLQSAVAEPRAADGVQAAVGAFVRLVVVPLLAPAPAPVCARRPRGDQHASTNADAAGTDIPAAEATAPRRRSRSPDDAAVGTARQWYALTPTAVFAWAVGFVATRTPRPATLITDSKYCADGLADWVPAWIAAARKKKEKAAAAAPTQPAAGATEAPGDHAAAADETAAADGWRTTKGERVTNEDIWRILYTLVKLREERAGAFVDDVVVAWCCLNALARCDADASHGAAPVTTPLDSPHARWAALCASARRCVTHPAVRRSFAEMIGLGADALTVMPMGAPAWAEPTRCAPGAWDSQLREGIALSVTTALAAVVAPAAATVLASPATGAARRRAMWEAVETKVVKGHSGIPGNEKADRLAVRGAQMAEALKESRAGGGLYPHTTAAAWLTMDLKLRESAKRMGLFD